MAFVFKRGLRTFSVARRGRVGAEVHDVDPINGKTRQAD
jgi:hypothetical protein